MIDAKFRKAFKRFAWGIAIILALALAVFAWNRLSSPTLASVVEYAMLEPRDTPTALAIAPDGTIWFTIDFAAAIGRVRAGRVERLPKPRTSLEPVGIAVTADGSVWFTDSEARQVSRIAPSGDITSITLETPVARLGKVAAAPDGSVWFAEATAYSISRIKDGRLERHVIDSIRGGPLGVAAAPDGSVWATLQSANQLLRIAPDGSMRSFDIPTRSSSPADVAVDADGVVWFIEFRGNKIARFANGSFEEFAIGKENAGLTGLAAAPDGSVWFGMLRLGSLGPYSVAVDPAGNVWYTDISGYVGMLRAESAKK